MCFLPPRGFDLAAWSPNIAGSLQIIVGIEKGARLGTIVADTIKNALELSAGAHLRQHPAPGCLVR